MSKDETTNTDQHELRSQLSAVEQLLDVYEEAVQDQALKLEGALAALRESEE